MHYIDTLGGIINEPSRDFLRKRILGLDADNTTLKGGGINRGKTHDCRRRLENNELPKPNHGQIRLLME
ncbi:hypothetical protein [Halolactibacillus alkaliphilus]|nr:hypothetical protein [Halolactibacillus alkaliphilus]